MKTGESILTAEETAFLVRRRVARLATADKSGAPYAVPVCYAYSSGSIYIALDEKPKDVPPTRLKRVRNIIENPNVALIADRYDEDWSLLAYVMVRGRAELLDPGTVEQTAAARLLRGKYHQYERMKIEEQPGDSDPSRAGSFLGRAGRAGAGRTFHPERHPGPPLGAQVPGAGGAGGEGRGGPRRPPAGPPRPTAAQPWRFAVLTGGEAKERLAEAMGEEWRSNLRMDGQGEEVVEKRLEGSRRRLLDAPVLVLLCLYLEDLDTYPDPERQQSETTMAVQSLGAAAQNMLLTAYSLGLDAGWMCAPLFCPGEVTEALGLDPKLIPHALLTLGYADGDPPKRPWSQAAGRVGRVPGIG